MQSNAKIGGLKMNDSSSMDNKTAAGFQGLLEGLVKRVVEEGDVYRKIKWILTLNGRINFENAVQSLTDFQIELLHLIREFVSNIQFVQKKTLVEAAVTYRLGVGRSGRIFLNPIHKVMTSSDFVEVEEDLMIGYLLIPEHLIDEAKRRLKHSPGHIRRGVLFQVAERSMEGLSQKALNAMIDYIDFICCHMAPVLYYLDDHMYSTFDRFNNLVNARGKRSKSFLFETLKNRPLAEWTADQIEFIYSLYYLLQSGPPARGEEFNGMQLNVERLDTFFNEKWYAYSLKQGFKTDIDRFKEKNLPDKARWLNRKRLTLTKDYTFYRKVNGLNLLKREHVYLKNEIMPFPNGFPDDLRKYFLHTYQLDATQFSSLYQFIYELTSSLDPKKASHLYPEIMNPIEEILHTTVLSAVTYTDSDIGMTRGLRDFKHLCHENDDHSIEALCLLKQPHFYCCAVPSAQMVQSLSNQGPALSGILKAISVRMQYNSWHYIPGNFDRRVIPKGRHFYFPPVMPDTAEWSDQHHRGHIYTGVRHSIRSPYHLTYRGKRYHAFFDLRLMRQKGKPYNKQDLQDTVRYTHYLHDIYQAVLDHVKENHFNFQVTSFTKKWYDQNYNGNEVFIKNIHKRSVPIG